MTKNWAIGCLRMFFRVAFMTTAIGSVVATGQSNGIQLLPESYFSKLPEEFQIQQGFDQPRSTLWPAFVSFILPGFDQWYEGQQPYGAVYSGVTAGGLLYAIHHAKAINAAKAETIEAEDEAETDGFSQPSERERRMLWGLQLYQLSGSLSAYHAYRTAIWTHKPLGRYQFIRRQESIQELASAPFRFEFLQRSTTLWPLGIGVGLAVLSNLAIKADPKIHTDAFTVSDAFFTSSLSYGAGVGEEALFRGFLLPEFREWMGSDFWSNASTSMLFAAAHLQTVQRPIPQLALGYYWGHLTQKNNWEISESIFIHTWWDVIAFLTVFQIVDKEQIQSGAIRPALHLPPLEWHF